MSTAHHRSLWRRSWRFELALLVAIILAGFLTYLARTVLYFPIDVQITRYIQDAPSPAVVRFLDIVSWIGFPPQSNVIFGLLMLGLFLVGWRIEAVMTLFAAAGSAGLWYWISAFVDRPRPSPDLVRVALELPSGGFPSGHVLNLTAIFGFLLYLAVVHVADARLRWGLVFLLALPVITIGIARVYAGAHWPSDALGGYLIGGIWLALTIQIYRWLGTRLRRRLPDDRADAEAPDHVDHTPRPVRSA